MEYKMYLTNMFKWLQIRSLPQSLDKVEVWKLMKFHESF